jgi:hypothetical protein
MFQTKVVEKIETHILYSITILRKWCCLWANMEKYDTTRHNIARRMLLACRITKARTQTQLYYWILIAFPRQQWLRERAWMLRLHVYRLSWCNRSCHLHSPPILDVYLARGESMAAHCSGSQGVYVIQNLQNNVSKCSWGWVLIFFKEKSGTCIIMLCLPPFLDAFAEFRNATINFVISVCPSVGMNQIDSHCTDFRAIWYLRIIPKSADRILVSLAV